MSSPEVIVGMSGGVDSSVAAALVLVAGALVGGFSWGFGDDAVWQFRKAGESIQLVRRNVRFTAERDSPTAKAVHLAYTDSVLFSLPIRTRSPQGAYLVDLTPVFMSDLPQIGLVLPGFSFSSQKSTWVDDAQSFAKNIHPKNIELQVAATYTSSGGREIVSVPDSRGVTVNVVAPGFIETDMTAVLPEDAKSALVGQIALGRLGQGVVRRRVLRSLHRTVIGVEDELLDADALERAETDLPIVGEGALMAQLSRARDRSM